MIGLEQHLRRCFASVFPNLTDDQMATASPDAVAEWDSLRAVILIALIEEEFHTEIDPVLWPDLGSFQAILHHLGEHVAVA